MPKNDKTDQEKATDIMREVDELMDDLDADFRHNLLMETRHRLSRVEEHLSKQQGGETTLERGERILAKAQAVGRQLMTPEGILAAAQEVMPDPTQVGIVQGYLAVGTPEAFAKAAELVATQMDRNDAAHATGVIDGMTRDLERDDDVHALREALENLRGDVAGLLDRIDRLERAPSAAPQMPVVAKAEGRNRSVAPPTAASLLSRGQGVIDSPTTIGVLSSLIQEGKLEEAQRMVEAAELDHETRVRTAERRRLQQQ